jgi:enamine deaminase RidA (YjgF/YER057c/UK114 family)
MQKTEVNPWTWQDQWGFSQAVKADDARTTLHVSGQTSMSAEGQPVHAGDFPAQTRLAFENLRAVLAAAGGSLDNVVKLNVFLIDMANIFEYGKVKSEFFTGPQPAASVVAVRALALPELMIEIEASAVL